jgi:hypothetical protein
MTDPQLQERTLCAMMPFGALTRSIAHRVRSYDICAGLV